MASAHSTSARSPQAAARNSVLKLTRAYSGMLMVGLRNETSPARRPGSGEGSGGSSEGSSAPALCLADGCERGPKYGCAPLLRQVRLFHDSAARGVNVCVGHCIGCKGCHGLIGRDHLCDLGS